MECPLVEQETKCNMAYDRHLSRRSDRINWELKNKELGKNVGLGRIYDLSVSENRIWNPNETVKSSGMLGVGKCVPLQIDEGDEMRQ